MPASSTMPRATPERVEFRLPSAEIVVAVAPPVLAGVAVGVVLTIWLCALGYLWRAPVRGRTITGGAVPRVRRADRGAPGFPRPAPLDSTRAHFAPEALDRGFAVPHFSAKLSRTESSPEPVLCGPQRFLLLPMGDKALKSRLERQ